ncbi:MAG TPA: acyltransferase family protein [Micavibrio sp.]|nr:acyltransferase family protein [Micavibrio sp.]
MSQITYRPDVDGLRTVAVLSVLFYHAGFSSIPGGFMGVDVFFVISGFLITSLIVKDIEQNRFSMMSFWERRARRILPPLFLVILMSYAIAWFLLLPPDFVQFGKEMASQSLFASNFLFLKQGGYFDVASDLKPLLHTWSLAVEEQYYLFFPIGMFLISRYFKRSYIPLLWLAAVFSFVIALLYVQTSQRYAFFLLPFRGWELLAGAILAIRGVPAITHRKNAELVGGAGALMLVAAIFFYNDDFLFPGYIALLPVLGTAAIIWANTGHVTFVGSTLSLRPFVFVGLISYSLYLWHWPLLVFARYATIPFPEYQVWIGPICIIASFLFAYLTWLLIERPVRGRHIFQSKWSIGFFSFAGLLVLAMVGAMTIAGKGFPSRFNDSVLNYALAQNDVNPRRAECDQPSIERLKSSEVCQTNEMAGRPDFALWGDSHGDAIAPAFDELSKKYNRNGYILTASGCKPSLHVENTSKVYKYNCIEQSREALNLIRREKIRNVFIVGLWTSFSRDAKLARVENGEWATVYKNFGDRNMAALAHTLDALLKEGVNVYFLITVPVAAQSPHRILALQEMMEASDRYNIPRGEYDRLRANTVFKFRELYKRPGLEYIDPVDYLCDEKRCLTSVDGYVLYYNASHLSKRGAVYMKPVLEKYFRNGFSGSGG